MRNTAAGAVMKHGDVVVDLPPGCKIVLFSRVLKILYSSAMQYAVKGKALNIHVVLQDLNQPRIQ